MKHFFAFNIYHRYVRLIPHSLICNFILSTQHDKFINTEAAVVDKIGRN